MFNKILTLFLLSSVSLMARIEVGPELRNPFEKADGDIKEVNSTKESDTDPSIAIRNGKFLKASVALRKLKVNGVMENKQQADNCILLIGSRVIKKGSYLRAKDLKIDTDVKILSITKNEFITELTIDSETRKLTIPIHKQ